MQIAYDFNKKNEGNMMTVEAKFTTAGLTKGKQYDVIEEKKSINGYKIVLDNGAVAVRHKCGFNIIKE